MLDEEAALREVIAAVCALHDELDNDRHRQRLRDIERKLGKLLPPVRGEFTINLDDMIKR